MQPGIDLTTESDARRSTLLAVALTLVSTLACAAAANPAIDQPSTGSPRYAKLPIGFEPNLGQSDDQVAFLARGRGYGLFLTEREAVMSLSKPKADRSRGAEAVTNATPPAVVRMSWVDANPRPNLRGLEQLPGLSHYLVGGDASNWRRDVPQFARIEYQELYPGIDLVFHGDESAVEYDFVIASGAKTDAIRMAFAGVSDLRLDRDGNLVLSLGDGEEVIQKAPVSYQQAGDLREPVRGRYVIHDNCEVGFAVAKYDRQRALVIDPVLVYSTYLGSVGGGGYDWAMSLAVDSAGNAYVLGYTSSTDFPVMAPFQATAAGGEYDAFLTKLDPLGGVLYSTYIGGSADEIGYDIAVDASGNAYVVGYTGSADFPTVAPFQGTFGQGYSDAFVFSLNSTGSALRYSTFLGGDSSDTGSGIAVDATGAAYVAGYTSSTDFPLMNPLQGINAGSTDAFVAKLSPLGSTLTYSTFLGGSNLDLANDVAVDGSGNAYVSGTTESTNLPTLVPVQVAYAGSSDLFIAKLDPTGSALVYATYLGGSDMEQYCQLTLDGAGNAYLVGITHSTDFPTANPLQATNAGAPDAFVVKLDAAGSSLHYSTYLGGTGPDGASGIVIDGAGGAVVAGYTASTDFPTLLPLQAANAGSLNLFIVKLDATGTGLTSASYLGGSDWDTGGPVALDGASNVYVVGSSKSLDYPMANPFQPTNAGGSYDAVVTKLDATGTSLVYSTYLGGANHDERSHGIAVDSSGSTYITGTTASTVFPTVSPLQPASGGDNDAFVAKLNATGSALDYATYLGGARLDEANGISVDSAGNAYVCGSTESVDFPTVAPFQSTHGGGTRDAFVAKLDPLGSTLVYSTFLGGELFDIAYALAVDGAGAAYVTGITESTLFPTTLGALQPAISGIFDGFVAKLDPAGSALAYATYLGGSNNDAARGIAVDGSGNAYVAGSTASTDFPTVAPMQGLNAGQGDAFVAKLNPAGAALLYSTYFGGRGGDEGYAIAIDAAGNSYLTGATLSTDLPTVAPIQATFGGFRDAYVAKIDASGSALAWSTYLGGNADEFGSGIAIDGNGNVVVTGGSGSIGFPTLSPLQTAYGGDDYDAFVVKIGPAATSFSYATLLGASGSDYALGVAVDSAGSVYITGNTNSTDFPTQGGIRSTGAGDADIFVAKVDSCAALPGRVARLMAVKSAPLDIAFSWDTEPLALGGYRVYAVDAAPSIPRANLGGMPVCVAAAAQLDCTQVGGLSPTPASVFYQVVGVCAGGADEGAL